MYKILIDTIELNHTFYLFDVIAWQKVLCANFPNSEVIVRRIL